MKTCAALHLALTISSCAVVSSLNTVKITAQWNHNPLKRSESHSRRGRPCVHSKKDEFLVEEDLTFDEIDYQNAQKKEQQKEKQQRNADLTFDEIDNQIAETTELRQEEQIISIDELEKRLDLDDGSCSVIADLEGEMLELEREKTRMESLEVYVLVSVLAATSSFVVIESETSESLISNAILAISSASALLGMYSTVVFSLCVLYGKTALGMKKDTLYKNFMDNTGLVRIRGFQAFSASLMMFSVEIVLEVGKKFPVAAQVPFMLVAGGAVVFLVKDWRAIMDKATPIFTGIIPTDDN